jgi:hypothetical protein
LDVFTFRQKKIDQPAILHFSRGQLTPTFFTAGTKYERDNHFTKIKPNFTKQNKKSQTNKDKNKRTNKPKQTKINQNQKSQGKTKNKQPNHLQFVTNDSTNQIKQKPNQIIRLGLRA